MGLLESLDAGLGGLVGQWNGYSTGLATLLVVVLTYRVMAAREPDVHPMLLARQAVPATVRNEGESAVYRSQAAPHSMPLNSGLSVRDDGASRWARGRDGDLRDVWHKAVAGGDGGARGKLLTVLGSERVVEHSLDDVGRQMAVIGRYIADQGGIKVAIYLPNSLELLVALLACSFYPNLTAVLIPFDVSDDELISMLCRSAVDTVVTAPGAFSFDAVVKAYPSLRQLVWVVDEGSSHMDWNEVPEGTGGSVNVATWQDIVKETAGAELPAAGGSEHGHSPQDVVTFWQAKDGQTGEMVRFTQANMVAGMAGQLAAVPTKERLGPSDLFVPADALTNMHTLVLTLTALYSNASVALNSVGGPAADLTLATQGVAPTVVAASAATAARAIAESSARLASGPARLSHWLATRRLTRDGVLAGGAAAAAGPAMGTKPGSVRLVYVAERAGAARPGLSTTALSDLRALTGARVMYALTAARVAGPVSQTAFYDYRAEAGEAGHFGAPPTSVEILLRDTGVHKTTDDAAEGEVVARGPCVSGGEARTDVVGRIRDDNTLAYA